MGKFKKSLGIVSLVFAAAFITFISIGWLDQTNLPISKPIENAAIRQVSFDGTDRSTLLLTVQSMSSKTIISSTAIIRDIDHKTIVAVCPVRTELPAYTNTTIAVGMNNILSSGNYTVTLETADNKFVSPSFNVP